MNMPAWAKASGQLRALYPQTDYFTAGISKFHLLDGLKDTAVAVKEISEEIRRAPVQLAFAGIGENGHLAFNDPPADFETQDAYAIVTLDEKCRQQQVGEGWFESLEEVPRTAISISVPQLLKSAGGILSA